MYINKNNKDWKIEDAVEFISKCLIAYVRINVKDQNKLVCLEEDFDTLDFNDVPYLLRNEFEVPEYIIERIRTFETLIKQLYIEQEIQGKLRKNDTLFLLKYKNKIYNLIYDGNIMTYSKSRKNINNIESNDYIIDFEYVKNYINENQAAKTI